MIIAEDEARRNGVLRENIPEKLRLEHKWVNWAAIWDDCKEKFSKPPMTASGHNASSTNRATWTTLEASTAALGRRGVYVDNGGNKHNVTLDGIGFAGLGRTPYTGIDLDHCIHRETGEIKPEALQVVHDFDSYTEITPSMEGLRIWIKGKKHQSWSTTKIGDAVIEIYDRGRFFTVTGRHLEHTPTVIEDRQDLLDDFMNTHAPPAKAQPVRTMYKGPESADTFDLDGRLDQWGVAILRSIRDATSERAYGIVCPWAHEHTGGDTSGTRVGQYLNGALWFHCEHAHCDGRRWEHLREHFEPGCYVPWWVKVVAKNG